MLPYFGNEERWKPQLANYNTCKQIKKTLRVKQAVDNKHGIYKLVN